MKIHYFADTDTLYFDLIDGPSSHTDAITENLIVDFDGAERVVGITVEHASQSIDLSSIETINLPETAARAGKS